MWFDISKVAVTHFLTTSLPLVQLLTLIKLVQPLTLIKLLQLLTLIKHIRRNHLYGSRLQTDNLEL